MAAAGGGNSGEGVGDGFEVRPSRSEDHAEVIGRVNSWWGGRSMADMLPRLFFDHFQETSFTAVGGGGEVVGFLVGFVSPSVPGEGYVHFMGVDPAWRGRGVGHALYVAAMVGFMGRGCDHVKCVTSPANAASLAFHGALGFEQAPPPGGVAAAASPPLVWPEYDGPGEDRVVLLKRI